MLKSLHYTDVSAAYDYYPFGMLMPERYAEDTGTQCAMVTRYRQVMVWQTAQVINDGAASLNAFEADGAQLSVNGAGVRAAAIAEDGTVSAALGNAAAGELVEVTVNIANSWQVPPYLKLTQNGAELANVTTGMQGGSYTLSGPHWREHAALALRVSVLVPRRYVVQIAILT